VLINAETLNKTSFSWLLNEFSYAPKDGKNNFFLWNEFSFYDYFDESLQCEEELIEKYLFSNKETPFEFRVSGVVLDCFLQYRFAILQVASELSQATPTKSHSAFRRNNNFR
jgi:hypothetical protein